MSAELVCIGLATLDTIVAVPEWPEPDGRLVVDGLLRAGGGPAATAAVAAAAAGRSVAFVGAVGRDDQATLVRHGLLAGGIDVTHLVEQAGPTPESVILVHGAGGTRSILHAPGATRESLGTAARAACDDATWIHVDHAGWPLAAGLPASRLSVDAGNPVAGLELAGLGLYAPTATALQRRYPSLPLAAAVRRALAEGAERVVVTLGRHGGVAADRDGAWRVAGADVDVVSTLGAGDVFHGVLLAALIERRALPDALRLANLAAALSCRALDARSSIPGADELERALGRSPAPQRIELESGA